jgi:hypothetical protein
MTIAPRLCDLERFTIYEYVDICSIPFLYKRDKKLFDLVIKKTNIEREFAVVNIDFLRPNYKRLNIWLNDVVYNGNLECIKFLRDKGTEFEYDTFCTAVRTGNLENMKWLRENGCEWDEGSFATAAECGNLEVMKWLKENKCPWDKWVFADAAEYGQLEVMKWLKENKCPWDIYVFTAAEHFGSLENIKWLKENLKRVKKIRAKDGYVYSG